MSTGRRRIAAALVVAAAVLLGGCQDTSASTSQGATVGAGDAAGTRPRPAAPSDAAADPSPSAPPTAAPADPAPAAPAPAAAPAAGTAEAALALLPVKGRAPMTGYSRDQFGPAWKDVDRNGCDTRNDVLARDLTGITRPSGCIVTAGTLQDPYSGETIAFVRGTTTSSLVQIDHLVALGDAWQKGAQQWDATRRTALANDPLNLLAVKGSLNEQKGDGDAATWLPPSKAFRCTYVARQVAVKYTYGLWVTQAEHDAIASILATCPGQPLPTGAAVPPVAVSSGGQAAAAAPAPAAPVPAAPAPAAPAAGPFANCTAAWAAGAAPLHIGDPGYAPKLDGDGDGIACEHKP
jgi:hypothetical protein